MEVGARVSCSGTCAGTASIHSTSRRSNFVVASVSVGVPIALAV